MEKPLNACVCGMGVGGRATAKLLSDEEEQDLYAEQIPFLKGKSDEELREYHKLKRKIQDEIRELDKLYVILARMSQEGPEVKKLVKAVIELRPDLRNSIIPFVSKFKARNN